MKEKEHSSIFGLYCPSEDNQREERILILMREPGKPYDRTNEKANEEWWRSLINKEKESLYRTTFEKWISIKADKNTSKLLEEVYYANIFPWGGGGKETKECKRYIRNRQCLCRCVPEGLTLEELDCDLKYDVKAGIRLKKIMDVAKPTIIFTCIDLYVLIKEVYGDKLKEDNDKGITYAKKKLPSLKRIKRFCKGSINEKCVKVYEIYHPTYRGWNIIKT